MDIRLFYEQTGSGDALVLLHGNGEDSGYFCNQIAAFANRFRVIAVDTRGHGRSPRGTAPFTLSQFSDDLAALMDCLGIRRANLLGYSDGGNIALLFALRYPGRVEKLVLNGANLYPSGLKPITWLGVTCGYLVYACAALFHRASAGRRDLYALMACQPHIRPARLRSITAPTLVLAGTGDVIRRGHTRLIAESLPNARLLFLPGGHDVALQAPEAYNKAVLAFLDG